MEREAVRNLFGKNFIGKDELKPFFRSMGLGDVDVHEKPIEYSDSDLIRAAESAKYNPKISPREIWCES